MSDEKQAPERIDINDPSLQMEELNVDVEKDQFAAMPVIPDGTYRAKLVQKKPNNDVDSLWLQGKTKKAGKPYLQTGIEARVIDPNGKFDNWPVFDNFVSTLVMEMTGTNKIVGILKAGGQQVPTRITNVDLAKQLDSFLQSEPEVGIVTEWEGYCETCEKTVVKGEKRFPKSKTGEGHEPSMECSKCGTTVNAQPRIKKYVAAEVAVSA